MTKKEKAQYTINIVAAVFLSLAIVMALLGVGSYTKNVFFAGEDRAGLGITARISSTYAWKYFHITAAVLALLAMGTQMVGTAMVAQAKDE